MPGRQSFCLSRSLHTVSRLRGDRPASAREREWSARMHACARTRDRVTRRLHPDSTSSFPFAEPHRPSRPPSAPLSPAWIPTRPPASSTRRHAATPRPPPPPRGIIPATLSPPPAPITLYRLPFPRRTQISSPHATSTPAGYVHCHLGIQKHRQAQNSVAAQVPRRLERRPRYTAVPSWLLASGRCSNCGGWCIQKRRKDIGRYPASDPLHHE